MSDTLDMATLLRNAANAKRTKSQGRVSSTKLLATVTEFLNNDEMDFVAVENTFPAGTKHPAIVARFRNIIIENKVDELVYPIVNNDHVYLVKLVESEA